MSLFRSLRIRNYRLFASGQAVSLTGTWMQRIAQDWLVLELTGSATALGVTLGLQFLPILLFGMYGGVLADRLPKRQLLIAVQAAMGVQALLLGVLDLTGVVQLWHVFGLAFVLGIATAVDMPTRQAFVVEMVGPDDVPNAVSLNSATFNLARIVGPAIAGFLIAGVGTAPVFLLNVLSFAAVLAGLWLMRDGELHVGSLVPRARGQLRAGLQYVRGRPDLLLPIALVGVIGTFGLNFQLTLALVARDVFGRGAGAYGVLSAMLAGGALLGALASARRTQVRQRVWVAAAIAFGVLEVAVGLMPTYVAFAVLLLPTGAAMLTFTTAVNSSLQLATDPEMRGRVMALYLVVFLGGTPLGAPIVGWLAEVFGARWSLILGGALSALAASLVALFLERRRRAGIARRSAPVGRPVPTPVPLGQPQR